ncbi:HipA family kinase [Streptomyces griseoincarnatus]
MVPRQRGQTHGVGYFDVALWGARVEDSSGGVSHLRLNTYARKNTPERPFAVANDFIASSLGIATGLPVPPGTLVGVHGGGYNYASLAFGDRGDKPPPIIPPQFCEERSWEACGIIAFDHWIHNTDRHDGNIGHLPNVAVAVFDHDLALLNEARSSEEALSLLAASQDVPVKFHCLPPHLKDVSHFGEWFDRIASVTRREIRRAVIAAHTAELVSAELRDALVAFLEHRQTRIGSFIEQTRDQYQNVDSWTLDIEEVDSGS